MTDVLIRAGSFVSIILLGYVLKKVGIFGEHKFVGVQWYGRVCVRQK